jgi:hypothetical protein
MFKKISRGSGLVGLVAALVLSMSLPRQASAGLTGSWSCFGSTTFSLQQTLPSKQVVANTFAYSELIHLGALNTDGFATGLLFYNFNNEVCKIPVTAIISVDATGVGTMRLTFTPNGSDLDSDFKCSSVFPSATKITETYVITTALAGKKFYFIGSDDSIAPTAIKDGGDFFVPAGTCEQQ